jgi:hypothetical protein
MAVLSEASKERPSPCKEEGHVLDGCQHASEALSYPRLQGRKRVRLQSQSQVAPALADQVFASIYEGSQSRVPKSAPMRVGAGVRLSEPMPHHSSTAKHVPSWFKGPSRLSRDLPFQPSPLPSCTSFALPLARRFPPMSSKLVSSLSRLAWLEKLAPWSLEPTVGG